VCSYCRHILVRKDDTYEATEHTSLVADDCTPYQIGSEGWYRGVHFGIIGRVRMAWSAGFWNEWHLFLDDGRFGWLTESQGQLAILFEEQSVEFLNYFREAMHLSEAPGRFLGNQITVEQIQYTCRDTKIASCIALEGELPKFIARHEQRVCIDMSSRQSRCITAEIDSERDTLRVFTGEYVSFQDLRVSHLRELEGWHPR
jgi:hypothetical protein